MHGVFVSQSFCHDAVLEVYTILLPFVYLADVF